VHSQLAFANDQQLVTLTWAIREGDQITIDHVLINGNARISTALIRRELTIQSRRPMSDDAMLESQRRLAAARPVPPRAHHRAAAHRVAHGATCSSTSRNRDDDD
jgi:hypothetical protein